MLFLSLLWLFCFHSFQCSRSKSCVNFYIDQVILSLSFVFISKSQHAQLLLRSNTIFLLFLRSIAYCAFPSFFFIPLFSCSRAAPAPSSRRSTNIGSGWLKSLLHPETLFFPRIVRERESTVHWLEETDPEQKVALTFRIPLTHSSLFVFCQWEWLPKWFWFLVGRNHIDMRLDGNKEQINCVQIFSDLLIFYVLCSTAYTVFLLLFLKNQCFVAFQKHEFEFFSMFL